MLYVIALPIEVDYPYNPDSDGNEVISIEDLLDLLPYYGGEFTVDEILIDGVTLVEYLTQVKCLLDEQVMKSKLFRKRYYPFNNKNR